jgi:RNA polymerase sigma-70 factor (ECF subfamily)
LPSDPANDRAELQALKEGDDRALNRLIDRWQRPLCSFAFRYVHNHTDAHDLVAETFVRLYQNRDALRADTTLSAWLFTALVNLCHNHNRWKRRHPTVALDSTPEGPNRPGSAPLSATLPSEQSGPDSALQQDETVNALRAAIDRLPHDLKTALLLHQYERLSYREIAQIVGCSERGVETRLYRARQQLRTELAFLRTEPSPRHP